MVRWEADRVQHALAKLNIKFVLLKGAAYVLLGLSPGNKRVASDVDILVPFNRLDEVEAAFKENGWHLKAEDTYDERYYREWMHELPPLQHNVRGAWLDVHHNIVPRTSRLCPDASSLLEGAIVVSGTKYLALCPADMAIHSILHGFYGGEFLSAFRDILDVHELLTDLPAAHPTFWADFTRRVAALKIERSVFYALRYAMLFFDTRVPENTLEIRATAAPNPITLALMDFAMADGDRRTKNDAQRTLGCTIAPRPFSLDQDASIDAFQAPFSQICQAPRYPSGIIIEIFRSLKNWFLLSQRPFAISIVKLQ